MPERRLETLGRPPPLSVRPDSDVEWLQFLRSRPEATAFHHPAWSQVLAEAYGYRPLVLVQADGDGRIEAGLPLLQLRGPNLGQSFDSLPFTDYCPPLAIDEPSLARLTANLVEWRRAARVRRIAIHGALVKIPGVHHVTRAVRHVLPLGCTSQQLRARWKGTQVDRAIRKAEREGVEAEISRSPDELLTFYRLHLETRRRLGVPVQPRRFLETLWKRVVAPGLGFTVVARSAGRPIAAALFLAWNGNLIFKYGGSDQKSWQLRPNNLVMWTAIDWACRHGYRVLDLGRSDLDNKGLRDFKSRWGAHELPLVYSYVAGAPPGSMPKAVTRAMARLIQSSPPIVCRVMGEVFYGWVPSVG